MATATEDDLDFTPMSDEELAQLAPSFRRLRPKIAHEESEQDLID